MTFSSMHNVVNLLRDHRWNFLERRRTVLVAAQRQAKRRLCCGGGDQRPMACRGPWLGSTAAKAFSFPYGKEFGMVIGKKKSWPSENAESGRLKRSIWSRAHPTRKSWRCFKGIFLGMVMFDLAFPTARLRVRFDRHSTCPEQCL